MTIRIVQWTTGNIGKQTVKAIAANPALELVGCYAWSPSKIGKDVGELCGIEPLGVKATNDVDALLALKPDCGGSSLMGTGVSPGFAQLLAIVIAGISERIDKITVREEAHTMGYDSPETEKPAGFGRPIDDPDLPRMTAEGTAVFGEAVALVADALGVELDAIVCEPEYAAALEDLDLGSWSIAKGCVAGIYASWQGRVGDRTLIELSVRW